MAIIFEPFPAQQEFIQDDHRIRVICSAKRSGKSEACYIDTILKAEKQPNYNDNGRDPYQIGIIAPTEGMLRRLVWPKFRKFAKPFEEDFNKSDQIMTWQTNNTMIKSFSGEKISRMEGEKLNHIFITEAFQCGEEVFFESLARTSDTMGTITIEGSLGPNIVNPKAHWIYKTFIENKFPDSRVWVWFTKDNPHFPQEELERMKATLSPRTFRAMFEIDWNTPATNLVYDDFSESNCGLYPYDDKLPTYVSVDWGWAHPVAVLWLQLDTKTNTVYVIDEFCQSKVTLEKLYEIMISKPYKISEYYCDIAGNQEREQTGRSNVQWFRDPKRSIHFKYRSSPVQKGITLVRNHIKTMTGQIRLFVNEPKCPKLIDSMRQYVYPEKNGSIVNENPVKKDDDINDALRYFFINRMDDSVNQPQFGSLSRWN
jgi:PBSX family phage terminase large subunit